jgi:hypothetical protein
LDVTDWKGIIVVAVVVAIVAETIHTLESVATLGYYLDPAYFGVWSKIMMPTAGPPPAEFYYYSALFALVSWGIFGFVYDRLGGAIRGTQGFRRGLKFGALIFLAAGIPTALTMYLLINLPSGLLAVWTFDQLILYLIGGVVAAKLIRLG